MTAQSVDAAPLLPHTPGPWVVFNDPHEIVIMPAGRKGDIAIIDMAPTGGDAKANARLIAAAPKLLVCCKAALGAFENNNAIDWSELRSAIDEAEGRT